MIDTEDFVSLPPEAWIQIKMLFELVCKSQIGTIGKSGLLIQKRQ